MIWIRNCEKIKAILKTTVSIALTLFSIYCAIHYSKECSDGVKLGLTLCLSVLVPSLFVFLVLSSLLVHSRLAFLLNKLLQKAVYFLLGLPKESAWVLIMSVLGGYPVGAKCISTLYKNKSISKSQAQKLSVIAVCSGPGFVINYVGCALLGNKASGQILFCSQLVGFFAVAFIFGRLIKVKDENVSDVKISTSTDIVSAIKGGCSATLNMCAMVVAFSAFLNILGAILRKTPMIYNALVLFFEVTLACNELSFAYPLYVISFAIGFGGICVHFQIFSILKDIKINKALFFFARIIQGITCFASTYILLILFPNACKVFSTVKEAVPSISSTQTGAVFLVLTAVCFLNSLNFTKYKRR